jgi:hypothetical protein
MIQSGIRLGIRVTVLDVGYGQRASQASTNLRAHQREMDACVATHVGSECTLVATHVFYTLDNNLYTSSKRSYMGGVHLDSKIRK